MARPLRGHAITQRGRRLPGRRVLARQAQSRYRFVRSWYASIRRSRRNGQWVRLDIHLVEIAVGNQHLFALDRPSRECGRRDRPRSCRPRTRSRRRTGAFVAHAIDRAHVHAVGDRVAPLDRLPGGLLLRAVLRLLRWEPADGGRDRTGSAAPLSAVSRAASGYHWSQQTSTPIRPNFVSQAAEAEVARGEVELLVVLRVVRDVHLPVFAEIATIGIDHGGGVVIETLGPLSNSEAMITTPSSAATRASARCWGRGSARRARRSDDPPSGRSTGCGTAPGRQTICAPLLRRLADASDRLTEVLGRIGRAAALHQAQRHRMRGSRHGPKIARATPGEARARVEPRPGGMATAG